MFGPLVAVVLGGGRVSAYLRRKTGGGRLTTSAMGAVLILTAALIGFGWMNKVNKAIASAIGISSAPTASLELKALSGDSSSENKIDVSRISLRLRGYPEVGALANLGPAPDFEGISRWYNTTADKPLSMGSLRGKVVLVDFWTYSCINCIRTLPHIKALDAKYRESGLVVVGVHTPEFRFEADPGNVARAIKDFGIGYPVALDPDSATWDNYYNRYWPAHYLIDRNGIIRSVHYGEGAYARTESEVRALLGLSPGVKEEDDRLSTADLTPETYLGYERAERFAGGSMTRDEKTRYRAPRTLHLDDWSYQGTWNVGASQSTAASGDAEIVLHFQASKVHIVAGPGDSGHGMIVARGPSGGNAVKVDGYRLYTLRDGDATEGTLRVSVSPGVQVFAFTFG